MITGSVVLLGVSFEAVVLGEGVPGFEHVHGADVGYLLGTHREDHR